MNHLPIEALESAFDARDRHRPLVVASPTGSGKSTRVPLWAARNGAVLVVEPRRVAARALACRVADESGTRPGEFAGWAVRDESVRSSGTRILFCTPGVALGMLGSGEIQSFSTWILDEFHERRSDVDALLAWARSTPEAGRVVLLSATMEAKAVAAELGAQVLESDGRSFPVDIEYGAEPGQVAPDSGGLPLRMERALRRLDAAEGTVLCFLPGVAEISDCASWIAGRVPGTVQVLHGGLPLEDQARVLAPFDGLRIVLSTNVAESALTVPDVVAVVDSGLERRIVRENGFPRLELLPISRASADQRAGRAGRVRPGRCLRLWSEHARPEARARPSIQVDDPQDWLLPILLAGRDPRRLPWLDRPRADGLDDAFARFSRMGLWERDPWNPAGGATTDLAREAARLPLPPDLAGFCLRLRGTAALLDGLALCSALSSGRPLFPGNPNPERLQARAALAGAGGDAALLARSLQLSEPQVRSLGAHLGAWREASLTFRKLCRRFGVEEGGWPAEFQSDALVRALWELEPRSLRRKRGKAGQEEYALGDGPGLRPSRQSLSLAGAPELALVLQSHGGVDAKGNRRVWIESAEALSAARAMRLGIGRPEVLDAKVAEGSVLARWSRRVGKDEIGREEGSTRDRDVWARAVARGLGSPRLDSIRHKLADLALESSLSAGEWVRPPEEPAAWVERILETNGEPPVCPAIPDPPDPGDPEALRTGFPTRWQDGRGTWTLGWDVWSGKVTARLEGAGSGKKGRPSLELPRNWTWR